MALQFLSTPLTFLNFFQTRINSTVYPISLGALKVTISVNSLVWYLGACGDVDYPGIFVRLDDPDVVKFSTQVIQSQNDAGKFFIQDYFSLA